MGLLGLAGGPIITTLVYFGYLNGFIGMIILTVVGIVVAVGLLLFNLMSGGVMETLTTARMRGNPIALILRNDKAVRFVEAKLEEGIGKTKSYGRFLIIPDSVYTLPNGVTTFLAYHKYGVSLNPHFIQATTRLREAGITDIEQVQALNKQANEQGKEFTINLDKNIFGYKPKREGENA